MLSWFGDFSFHALGSFENRRLVGFFSFLFYPYEGEPRVFGADGRWDTKKIGATTWSKVRPVMAMRMAGRRVMSFRSGQERISFSCSFFDDQKMPLGSFRIHDFS